MRFILVAVAVLAAAAGVAMYLWGVPPSLRPGPEFDAVRSEAEQGDSYAQSRLGYLYATGEGVGEDDVEAVRWWRLAAEQGEPTAQYNLGLMYAAGEGVLKDDAEAVRWWHLAAEQGNVDAQYALGSVYAGAPGGAAEALRNAEADPLALVAGLLLGTVPTDFVLAHMWLNIAAANGHEDAALGRDALELLMSAAAVTRATRLARACRVSDYRDCGPAARPRHPVAAREPALDQPTRRLIQQGLVKEGFDPGVPDGLFGPRTRATIRAWQASRGVAATGYLDEAQAELLRSAAAPEPEAPAPPPPPAAARARQAAAPAGLAGSEFFTRGSHQDDVLRLQGTPTSIATLPDSEIWWYGISTVTISKRSREVTEWSNLAGNLRVRLFPAPPPSGLPRTADSARGAVFRPGAGIVNPRLLREVRPQYTAEALRAEIAGTVYLEMVVLPDGTVGDVRITRSLDPVFGLDEEAVKAARQWLFEPGTRFGEPVAILVNLALDFNLR